MHCWCLQGAAFLPSILVIWSSAGFLFSYIISVLIGHVPPFVPYISDTGTSPPESGVFGFMISVSAMLGAATMYTRYMILERQNLSIDFLPIYFNKISLAIGLFGCIGMGIVATFQEMAVPAVHDAGALITFICGVMYILLQSYISYKSCPTWNTRATCHIRMTVSLIAFIAVGYPYHLTSAICEWTVAFGFNMYFLTFIRDFQLIPVWDDEWDDSSSTAAEEPAGPTCGSYSGGYHDYEGSGSSRFRLYTRSDLPPSPYSTSASIASSQAQPLLALREERRGGFRGGGGGGPDGPEWQENPYPFRCSIDEPTKQTKFKGIKSYISYRLLPSHTGLQVHRRYKNTSTGSTRISSSSSQSCHSRKVFMCWSRRVLIRSFNSLHLTSHAGVSIQISTEIHEDF
ncbi:hypothetical protein XELAEV_18017373mg [Xenopus laevis]|uniref:CWH43-like N-terminal domain-containing protein n=1 Tax=Xenopus laevis TaxID=8355 RepID=A0A974HSS7_XENLA|nr:hypothetical protein XELAEV_18017373mg [Xenopus laevis]